MAWEPAHEQTVYDALIAEYVGQTALLYAGVQAAAI